MTHSVKHLGRTHQAGDLPPGKVDGRLPNFLIIGAQKAGTTSLWRYLQGHPRIFMPAHKEPNFFVAEYNWDRGLAWYKRLFQLGNSAQAVGEASPRYTMYPIHTGVPQRIASTLSQPKLIYLVRDPIERMVSHYLHLVAKGTIRESFEETVRNDPWYLTTSRYGLQLSSYLDHFPPEQILVVVSEQLRDNRQETLAHVFDFLGVPPCPDLPEAANDYHVTAEKLAPRGPIYPPTLLPNGYRVRLARMTRRIPEPVKAVGRKLTYKQLPAAEVPPGLRRELAAQLHDDVAFIRQLAPPSFDGWGIA